MFNDRKKLNTIASITAEYIGKDYKAKFCHMSENATYIDYKDNTPQYTIRISRKGCRTYSELNSEIEWLLLLQSEFMPVPKPIKINKQYINTIENHFVVAFKYINGKLPEYNDTSVMYQCGKLAALLHKSPKPENADRPIWSLENMTGKNGLWGDWRENKELNEKDKINIEKVLEKIKQNISSYKTDKYGLIHIDLRMTNIIIGDKYYAIDFDDCGYGYYIQDLASALSFMEDSPKINELKEAWYKGYEEILPLTLNDKEMADSFIILRRIQLLAWITSHSDSDYVKTVSSGFVSKTMKLINNINLL